MKLCHLSVKKYPHTLQDSRGTPSALDSFTSDSPSMENPMDIITMMETDEMEEVLALMVVDEPLETTSCFSPLESMPSDAMNVVLSCLTFNEFQRLSILSKRLSAGVSNSSHLYMNGHSYSSSSSSPTQNMLHPTSEMRHPHPHTMTHRRSVEFLPPEDDLRRLLGRFRCLNSLHLQGLAVVGDEVVSILNDSPAADTITHIFLHGCSLSYWCSESFQLKHLQHVTICGGQIRASVCSLLKDSQHLRSLSIGQCSAMRDDKVSDIAKQTFLLESLTLNQCVRLRQPVIKFPKLETLNLSGCFGLTSLPQFACPNLKELDLSFCVHLSGEKIQEIVSKLPRLEELVMVKCAGVQSLNISSKTLRLLNLSFCSLTELRLHCPKLQVLENMSCSGISTMVLENAFGLHALDLSPSPLLERLEVQAPNLVQLSLEGCRRLDQCRIVCPRLERVNIQGSRRVALRFCKNIRQVLIRSWSMDLHR